LRLRVASAAVLAPVALACVWFGGWAFTLMVLAGFAGVVWEWAGMCGRRPLPLALGVIYCVVALASLWLLRVRIGAAPVFFLLMVVWCSDIGAYAVGRVIGGPRLAPAISPGKTWSGAVGGLVAAMAGGVAVSGVSMRAAAAAMVLGIASQLGDLGESALKRHYRVKDSGRLIPGHGGLLDRLDGLMAAAVVVGAFLALWLATGTDGAVRP
jgi:phosphatidate cytidylyltransferase